jgi:hypothetical protein
MVTRAAEVVAAVLRHSAEGAFGLDLRGQLVEEAFLQSHVGLEAGHVVCIPGTKLVREFESMPDLKLRKPAAVECAHEDDEDHGSSGVGRAA